MAAVAFHQAIGTLQPHGCLNNSGFCQEYGNISVKLVSKVDFGILRGGRYNSSERNVGVVQASTSHTSVFDPVSAPSNNSTADSKKKSGMPP